MIEIGFDAALMPLIRDGSKTLTYRVGPKYAGLDLGDEVMAVCPGWEPIPLRITNKWPGKFSILPLDDPRHELYESREELQVTFGKYYGRTIADDEKVVVLAFERTGP